jgi:taurine dioxygenase
MSSTTPVGSAITSRFSGVKVIPSGKTLGAEIQGVDIGTMTDDEFAFVTRAWLDHLVVLVRGQALTDRDLIAFSRRLGDLDWAPVQEAGRRFVEGHPEIYVVSNVMENGVPIGSLGAGEATWHTDMSYLENPPKASMLYALEVPPAGGDTYFCSMYRAYEALPDTLKQRISGLVLKHDGTYNSGGYVRQGVFATDDPVSAPGVYHPLVCTHPETGRRLLYLGRRRNAHIRGIPLAASEALLDELWSHATLRQTLHGLFDLLAGDHHQLGHFADHHDAERQRLQRPPPLPRAPPAA